ncbi:hypothetical protein [Legionella sp. PC997]|uniref:hypothetical protein n=1 Tax=Legionella sp. PC997 TaxID=2755562 RepID=UPI0015FCD169|nr:hypothetical protein [Legionella sp. PC997]QMT61824.1 hypothetical protein HBNCFIEN_03230 [Legionella sp. PC997]
MKPKNIILVLGDDKTTLVAAQDIAKQLPNNEIRVFSPACLVGLRPSDVARITVVGHAHHSGYGAANFSPKNFVEAFDEARKNAGFKKEDINRLRCFGCELGLIKEGSSYAQKMADEFHLRGYPLKLSAFTNRHATPLQNMIVGIAPGGGVNVYGYKTALHSYKDQELKEKLKAKSEEIEKLQAKVSFMDFIRGDTKATRAVNKALQEYDAIVEEQKKLRIQVAEEKHPIKALDHDEKYQFLPSVKPQDLQKRIKFLEENIARCENNMQVLQAIDPVMTTYMKERKTELEKELSTIKNYLATEANKDLEEKPLPAKEKDVLLVKPNLSKDPHLLEKDSTQTLLQKAWQGFKQFFSGLFIKSSASEEVTLAGLNSNPKVVENRQETSISKSENAKVPIVNPIEEKPVAPFKTKAMETRETVTYPSEKKRSSPLEMKDFKAELKQLREENQLQKQEEPQNEMHSRPVI